MVLLSEAVIRRYERFSLYNSPYPAHDRGCAVDLYPGDDEALSPVAGEVLETRTVRCPPKPYAVDEDHLILLDCGDVVARLLHVDPTVEPGDSVAVGDPLGTLIRSGFFGQWVDNHIHLGFRRHDQNLRRASGSLPLTLGVAVDGSTWDGIGRVVETGPAHVQLDTPGRETDGFVALASDEGVPLDGGLRHYEGGGVFHSHSSADVSSSSEATNVPFDGAVSLLGTTVGTADGRDVSWADVAVYADERRATGLSLFASQIQFGAKVVFHEGHDFSVGDRIEVTIEPTNDPIRLG
jgi:hypothetical protein